MDKQIIWVEGYKKRNTTKTLPIYSLNIKKFIEFYFLNEFCIKY